MQELQKTANDACFEALSRVCLNNWHYISRKTLSFSKEINFFTGHSGSGKSTVIDAMQIVLYANTDGRGFFNKAAADDSDRSLIEYLRGMVNIGENGDFAYLRNRNFSTTIVLELKRTDNEECQCVGVVFDVETANNTISRRFFWHTGPLWENEYRVEERPMTIAEVERWMKEHYSKEEYFTTSHNERFRRQLYENYLGGLDQEKFPLLFKRAIPFRMNIRLEDFVREYICMEQNIHIEEMQESVMLYGQMRRKIEETCREIEYLTKLSEQYQEIGRKERKAQKERWFLKRFNLLKLRRQINEGILQISAAEEEVKQKEEQERSARMQAEVLREQSDSLLKKISSTGYEELKERLKNLNELMEHLEKSEARWQQTTEELRKWTDEDTTSNRTLWDIEEFEQRTIEKDTLLRLKDSLLEMHQDAAKQKQTAVSEVRELKRKEKQAKEELDLLKGGNKAYPKYIEYVRSYLQRRLLEETGRSIDVHVLADLLDIRTEEWRNAAEGYLAGSKLALVVPPAHAKKAMEIYGELDSRQYWGAAVLDTEKIASLKDTAEKGSLAEEVTVQAEYLEAYLRRLLGRVMKCRSIEELKQTQTGITPECLMYRGFRLQYLNPDTYTKSAYIGKASVKRRVRILEEEIRLLQEARLPQEELIQECDRILELETLSLEAGEYLGWLEDSRSLKNRKKEKETLRADLLRLKEQDVGVWEAERVSVEAMHSAKEEEIRELGRQVSRSQEEITRRKADIVQQQEVLTQAEQEFAEFDKAAVLEDAEASGSWSQEFARLSAENETLRYDRLCEQCRERAEAAEAGAEALFAVLVEERLRYLKAYPNRSFSPSAKENTAYDALLETLQCGDLASYREKAAEQAKTAAEHFKDDFMFKIRSAIREAVQRTKELNRVISSLNFGKDKYQFVIGKNKGADGRFYDMFMDDALEVNPADLGQSMDNQLNFFTMEHESQYAELMEELISIFIPPEHAAPEEMEEARRNMDRYADYRTYLSFDMQQLIQNEDGVMKLQLSKMLKKNSGGEGQNPLYVALLASFAQAYHIGLKPGLRRNPSIRLVVLDEAFSKMDAEKVASCIQLIRDLGFQAIISATNDKIQNYVENVNKTFVFANPNKKSISIQEFEREQLKKIPLS